MCAEKAGGGAPYQRVVRRRGWGATPSRIYLLKPEYSVGCLMGVTVMIMVLPLTAR